MENYDDLYKTICRVCLSFGNSDNMVSLIDIASEDRLSCFGKATQIFANIRIKNDYLPNSMCNECLCLLKQAIIFKKKCEGSCERLTKLIEKCRNPESEIKEKIAQYVMFTNYFDGEDLLEKQMNEKSSRNAQENQPVEVTITSATDKKISDSNYDDDDFEDLFDKDALLGDEGSSDVEKTLDNELEADKILETIELTLNMDTTLLNSFRHKYYRYDRSTKLGGFKKKKVKTPKIERKTEILCIKRQAFQSKSKKEKDTTCKICHKKYANSYSLKNHMERHFDHSQRFVCEHCAKRMATLGELRYHLAATHNVGNFFICNYCGFKLPKKFELKEHIRIHTGERPYACEKCGLTFRRRYVWKKHALYHMERNVKCPRCPKKFVHRFAMQAHVNNVHERMYVYACSECEVTYAKPSTVRRHLAEKHGVPKEIQGRIKKINLGKSTIL